MHDRKSARSLTEGAAVAALYLLLTLLSSLLGIGNGAIQFRLSESLAILPIFSRAAIPGLFVGCLLANLLTGCAPWDILFGAAASLLGAVAVRLLRKLPCIATLPYALINTVTVSLVLRCVYAAKKSLPLLLLTVGIGELVCGYLLAYLLYRLLLPYSSLLFQNQNRRKEPRK